uniref:Coatomer subunit epsilon n=1 Tax=Mantoniella antarctica TaxID=81844 RepID=A0A7S0X2A7_9CHLO|mmetsp:Transcript_46158/g.73965  ORF Transcript_46158/g.73965 Transcript_46158/m.73965 type:complete len:291 (+) Transcript_46158:167-1039(+)|eukprot:CAMPEP_0181362144 /NCGR_PEP_ID=MMETSP1106-20121128/7797_1 /TAXON_ID=81844 /ORGANISM="Mantoniella antarctica, Strain SL-175" /LENGTH=290 /DNA_ID=CAMNT_0023475973 /DNA_START=173 /DNA_END=1045 /DNA_ORIENTATION=+
MGDNLFPVYNNFFIGAYQVAINEASDLQGLTSTEETERDCYMYRAYIALGSYQLVIDAITDSHPTALQAVRLLAQYLSRPHERAQCVATVAEWLGDGALAASATVQLIAALVYSHEGNTPDALKCCHSGLSLELMGLMVHLLIRMDRPELADKHLKVMQNADDDATLTQLATASVNLAQGGSKMQDAFYVFQELGDKYSWTPKLYNGSAVCQMAMGRYDDAEKDLVEAINKDSKDPDTLQNLAVCSLHLGKPVTRFVNQLKTLVPKPAAITQLESLEAAFDSANSAYVSA